MLEGYKTDLKTDSQNEAPTQRHAFFLCVHCVQVRVVKDRLKCDSSVHFLFPFLRLCNRENADPLFYVSDELWYSGEALPPHRETVSNSIIRCSFYLQILFYTSTMTT